MPPPSALVIRPNNMRADTIAAGDGLCVEAAVHVLVEDGVRYVHELIEWGARFDRDTDGALSLGREGAHGRRRVLHAADATGRELGRTLWERVAEQARVRVERNARVHRTDRRGRPLHRRAILRSAIGVEEVHAGAVLLATGGAGQVFRETTNPSIATGDGVMLGVVCRRARRRSRVRAVSSDRARRAGRAAIPVVGSVARRRRRSC